MYKQILSNKRRTIFLFGLILILIIGLGYFLGWYYQAPEILFLAVIFSITQALIAYYSSDKIVLAVSGAREAKRADYLALHRIVENLAITAGLPKPKIYLISDPALNAFATGRDPQHASVAVTSGLVEKLNKTQLEGVISHELSHIKNYDIRLMTMVVVLVGTIALATDMALRWGLWGGFSSRRREGGNWLAIVGLALIILSYLFVWLIKLAISRKREYLADASGALLTRYPQGLAEALEIISRDRHELRTASRATAHLFISRPFKQKTLALFSTHPPIRERIARLRKMIK